MLGRNLMKAMSLATTKGEPEKGMTKEEMEKKKKDPKFVAKSQAKYADDAANKEAADKLKKAGVKPTVENVRGYRSSGKKTLPSGHTVR